MVSARYSHRPELLRGMGEAQYTVKSGHFSRNRSEGEALEESRKEKERLHFGQGLTETHTFTCGETEVFVFCIWWQSYCKWEL